MHAFEHDSMGLEMSCEQYTRHQMAIAGVRFDFRPLANRLSSQAILPVMATVPDNSSAAPAVLPRLAAGDEHAMDDLMQQYGGLVWSLARKALPTLQDAEDATQEIFVEIWKSASRFDASMGTETTFVATITRRRLIDRQRRRGRRIQEHAIADAIETLPDAPMHAPSDSTGAAHDALAQLSDDQRKVLELSLVYGLSHEKIARATGMPLGTVKTHARRGLIQARSYMRQRSERGAS